MTQTSTYSICGMCTCRCPVQVDVVDGKVKHVWGNPHALGGHQLCPRGAAAKTMEYDNERPQYPMIRDGKRGTGKFRRVSWEEALDYVAEKLAAIKKKHGARALAMSDRGGPHREFHKTFLSAYGSPNYFTHHATCSNSVHNAHMSVAGQPRNGVAYDVGRCKHMVAFGRNFFESLKTNEARSLIKMIEGGGKFTFFDVRWNFTAAKATDFQIVRPGTDYAIVLAMINVLLTESIYQKEFVSDWVTGLRELEEFVQPYTPEFAEKESGVPARFIVNLARDLAAKAPSVIIHPGWMTAWGANDYYLRRGLYALNALLGNYEAPGGMVFSKGPGDCGVKVRQLTSIAPKPETSQRCDGIGDEIKHLGKGWGMLQKLPQAIISGKPYPVKAYFCMRHDPLNSLPDPEAFKKGINKLDLFVVCDINWSEMAWQADVILPECTFLERTDNISNLKGLKPKLALRQQAVEPRFDTKPRWWIFKELGKRLGLDEYFPYETIDDYLEWSLEGTKFKPADFKKTGVIPLTKNEIWFDRKTGLKFKTPSGKIEMVSTMLTEAGVPSWDAYVRPAKLKKNEFRLITGKTAVHTQGRTTANNPLLNEIVSENPFQIHTDRAKALGVKDGDSIQLKNGTAVATGKVTVTDFIHPEVVYTLHGFGDTVPLRTRSHGKGVCDARLARGALVETIGGNCPVTDAVITISKAK
ncbi:MAG: molybdopterin-dependent oxidoreductase [bacterium]|nr:molybdopterin-dependent oxidoreductase [bacterium]